MLENGMKRACESHAFLFYFIFIVFYLTAFV